MSICSQAFQAVQAYAAVIGQDGLAISHNVELINTLGQLRKTEVVTT